MIVVFFGILLLVTVILIVGLIIGFFVGRSYGREETELKYAPKKDWQVKEAVSYERKEGGK